MTGKHTGTRPPTSKDVAALAGVSQSTVSFVINGKSVVSEATRKRVEEAMRKLNYQPNAGARTLKTNKTNIIALFVEMNETFDANETTPYIDAVVKLARKHDYDVIINTTHEGSMALRRLAGKSICDAFILMDIQRNDERIPTAAELNTPVVLVGRPDNALGLDVVDFDAREAAYLAVDELADTGHRHIAMVGNTLGSNGDEFRFSNEFFSGAHERADQRGLDFIIVPRLVEGWEGIRRSTDQLLQHVDDRLGIIVRQPQPTEWLLRALSERGLVPGRDLSVVSHCSDLSATSFQWPVTNVSTRPEEVSNQAMTVLFDRLHGSTAAPHCDLIEPTGITRRATTIDWNTR
ncbi:LacI family DNA-binding transcriptional regulator [Bifidobacterium sp. LC6]|uniref:LacI family DNA-binding transcriptional regulator n=1 Tax=Bifidobacterium colobi TaxID=2809026 RepID=A0ABS5UU47_9BIFI|nr:LacI family DNA-binding transcriptional regulator [Bifidobacterium colobi]MBT1174184.1 LacI family DNA-binding transcriptional regulator [Bifidobacterium colobi]